MFFPRIMVYCNENTYQLVNIIIIKESIYGERIIKYKEFKGKYR